MKIGFYSPYFDSLSGGESYVLSLASHWSKSHDVSLFWDDASIPKKAQSRFGLDLSRVRTVKNVFASRNVFAKLLVSRGYDLIFFLTDGSIPSTFARYNILHVQAPFQHVRVHDIKLGRFNSIVCNSDFTKRNLDTRLASRATIIYPPVTQVARAHSAKKKIILSVGRFHPLKKQDVLIESFRKGNFTGYELVLCGGLLPSDEPYFKRLKFTSRELPVRLLPNATLKMIHGLYSQSSVYWHAAGYHETNPLHMEHFGISTVEAMSAGAVPVVYSGGGLPEIVREGKEGFLWANTGDLVHKTQKILASSSLMESLAKSAMARSHQFSVSRFTEAFDALLTTLTQ